VQGIGGEERARNRECEERRMALEMCATRNEAVVSREVGGASTEKVEQIVFLLARSRSDRDCLIRPR
jgi:hypothetical protein